MNELTREEMISELNKLSLELIIIDMADRFKSYYKKLVDKYYIRAYKLKRLMQKRKHSVLAKEKYLKANAEYEFIALADCYNNPVFLHVRKEILKQRYGHLGFDIFDFYDVSNLVSLMQNSGFSFEQALDIVNKTNNSKIQ